MRQGQIVNEILGERLGGLQLVEVLGGPLGNPTCDELIDDDLVQTLSVLHHENPAARRTSPLERFLDYSPELNRVSLYSMLRYIVESLTLPRTFAFRCQISALAK